jgi:transposase-like protein
MGETRRKFDKELEEDAVRLVREMGKPIAQVAQDLGVSEGIVGNWVNAERRRRAHVRGVTPHPAASAGPARAAPAADCLSRSADRRSLGMRGSLRFPDRHNSRSSDLRPPLHSE